ncbi:MAG: SDR family NAD(P)-dependent oxidoreductase [Xanthobacteraceae bacterium]
MATERSLEGKVAIITGSVRRLGKAMALALAKDGASVIINARASRDEAEKAAAEVATAGGRSLVHIGDITDEASVKQMVDATLKAFGRIDILINNAAIRGEAPLLDMTYQQWRGVLDIILDGAFHCTRAVAPHMVKNKFGRIINLGGVSSHLGAAGRAHVGTGKAGIIGFTRAVATELAPYGITVNCIVPGRIGGQRSATSGQGIGHAPLVGREGIPDDVAGLARLLCQPETSYITGQTIHVSGGIFMP